MNKLLNKVIIVTGGTKGIGRAISKLFVQEGAKIIAVSRKPLKWNKKNIETISVNIANNDECNKLIKYVLKKYKKIDVLINNAGIIRDSLTEKMTVSDFDLVIKTNLYGTFNMTKAVANQMLKQKYGNIINLSSVVATYGNFGQANYVASKAAIEGMTKCWAREFSRHGENIRVNSIAPGPVKTDIFKNTKPELIEQMKCKTMLKKFATVSDIANVALFLASDDSSCITATTIHADCGLISQLV